MKFSKKGQIRSKMAKDGAKSGKIEGEWIYKENRPSICSDSGLYSFYTHDLTSLSQSRFLKARVPRLIAI